MSLSTCQRSPRHQRSLRRRPREGSEPRPRRPHAHRVGRAQHAGAARDPRAVREGAAAEGHAHRRLPARHHRDREPGAHAPGRRRRSVPVRLESAQHAGRRGRRAGRSLRHRDVRDQGRGSQDLLLAHRLVHRGAPAHHHGRRLRPRHRASHQEEELPARRVRGHRGDLDRRDATARHGGEPRAALPGDRDQRRRHQAPVRQPLRHRPEHHGRHHPLRPTCWSRARRW